MLVPVEEEFSLRLCAEISLNAWNAALLHRSLDYSSQRNWNADKTSLPSMNAVQVFASDEQRSQFLDKDRVFMKNKWGEGGVTLSPCQEPSLVFVISALGARGWAMNTRDTLLGELPPHYARHYSESSAYARRLSLHLRDSYIRRTWKLLLVRVAGI